MMQANSAKVPFEYTNNDGDVSISFFTTFEREIDGNGKRGVSHVTHLPLALTIPLHFTLYVNYLGCL